MSINFNCPLITNFQLNEDLNVQLEINNFDKNGLIEINYPFFYYFNTSIIISRCIKIKICKNYKNCKNIQLIIIIINM